MGYDCIIVGTGAAGLSAAIYAGRYRMKAVAFGDQFGGLNSTAGDIQNYPGYVSIDGFDLVMNMKEQAIVSGAEVRDGRIARIEKTDDGCFRVETEKGEEHFAPTIIIATGSAHRHLGLPHEKEWTGRGVHYCATCDAPLYAGKTIAIVGGGDGAIKGAALAAEYAEKLFILVRGPKLRAEPVNVEHLMKFKDKVDILYETEVVELLGTDRLEGVRLSRPYKESADLALDGLFIEIGQEPQVGLAEQLGISLDANRYVNTNPSLATNVPGAFVAGDVSNLFGAFRQDITVAAMGAVAATSAYTYLKTHGDLCRKHWVPPQNSVEQPA